MPEAPRPPDETARLQALRAYDILDTAPEPSFDRLSRLASHILCTPIALVTLVDDERQWFKSRVGFDLAETSRAASFCAYAVADRAMVVVPDAAADPRFHDNPLVLGAPGIRFYAGAPLTTPGGFVLGSLCGVDTVPHREGLSERQRQQLTDLAALVVDELELRRSVRLLAEQQRQLEVVTLATEAASDAILITDATPISAPDGPRIVYANQAFLDMSGYDRAEVIGRTPRLVQGPETDQAALARIREAIHAGREVREELLNYRKDGTPYWVEVRISPVVAHDSQAPQLIAVQRDITQRRAREEDLREREARYRMLFEKNPQCMWVFDAVTGAFLDVNDTAVALYGYSRDEFLAMTIFDIRPAEDVEQARAALAQAPEGLGHSGEWRHRRKDGTIVNVRIQSFGTRHQGRPARLALVTDVSAERQLEEQLRQSQKMEALGTLAGGVAHDFNNLLTVINGYAEMLLGQVTDDQRVREELQQIQRAGERAASLTQQLLAFSRRQVLLPQVVSAASVLRDLQPMLARVLRENITLTITADEALPPVLVDPNQLELVLLNLVVNAADAMPHGGDLLIECREQVVEPEGPHHDDVRPGRYLVLAVSDTGVGMDASMLARVFEPFFTTKPKGRGTGLGLPTAYGIVKQSQGHLTAYSEPGIGSTFRVYLPVVERGAAAASLPSRAATTDLHGDETILLIEDDGGVRHFAEDLLRAYGYDVVTAEDGPTALRLAGERPGRIDLVLTDVVMPRMGGREVADALRHAVGVGRVVYMSGYTEDAILSRGALEPGLYFLPKPFTSTQLLQKVRDVLDAAPPVLTVVVADDEAPLRRLLALTLQRAGYHVLEARNGREAIELCLRHRVDLLLTDLVMPEQEGLETIRKLRADLPQVQIVAMSGAFDGKFLNVARAFGANAVLQKPFDGRTVLETVSSLIGSP